MPKYLSPEKVQFYKDNGFIKLENILSAEELETISNEYNELFTRKNDIGLEAHWKGPLFDQATKKKPVSVLSIHNLQHHSAVFTRLIMNDKMLDALEDIMGTPNILLHHTKAHLKPPEKGAPYLMHQDYHYFPFKNDSMVAVFIHLDDSSPENGGLAVYPGSHKLGPLEDKGVESEGQLYHYLDQDKYPISKATPINAKKGDIVVFSYLLIHGSFVNSTKDKVRRMFLIQLMSAEDEPLTDVHKSHGQGLVLRGKNVKRDASMANRFVEGDN